jgi:hypothetical protein
MVGSQSRVERAGMFDSPGSRIDIHWDNLGSIEE